MQDILRRVHESDDGGAAMADALGVEPPGDAAGPLADASEASRAHVNGGGTDSGDEGDVVSPEEPLSEATLRRVLASAQASGDGGAASFEVALEQLDPRELREFNRFVTSGQVRDISEKVQKILVNGKDTRAWYSHIPACEPLA